VPHVVPPVYFLTAPGREEILAGTLARWAQCGWSGEPVIHVDPTPRTYASNGRAVPPMVRMLAAYRTLLARALEETTAPHFLLLEDDIAFASGFAEKIAAWEPLARGWVTGFASFFNPGVRLASHGAASSGADYFLAHRRSVLGSQALLLDRDFAAIARDEWDTLDGFASMRLAALAARLHRPIYYHRPSLVEHASQVSAWGGHLRRAVDFAG